MMTITLKQVDDALYERIDRLARLQQTSVEEVIVTVLRGALDSKAPTLRERAEAIAAMTPKDVVQSDSTLLIREDRDR